MNLSKFTWLRVLLILLLIIASVYNNHLLCQEDQDSVELNRINFADFHLDLAIPVNTYGSRIPGTGIGVSGLVLRQSSPNSPRFFGLGTNYHFFDTYSIEDVIFLEGVAVDVRDRTSTHEIGLFLMGRQFLPYKVAKMEFFVDLKIGIRWLYAVTSLYDLEFDENISSDISSSGFAFNLGLGGGLQYPLTDDFSITSRLMYNAGSKTDYFARLDNEPTEFSEDAFQEFNSTTDLISFSLGLSWIF